MVKKFAWVMAKDETSNYCQQTRQVVKTCFSRIVGSMRTPTAALETLLNLPSFHFVIKRRVRTVQFRLENPPSYSGLGKPYVGEWILNIFTDYMTELYL